MSDFIAIPEPATPEYPEAIKMIMPGEHAAGGPGGPSNVQAAGLVRRTQWLKENKEDKADKGVPGGYVPLGEDGKVDDAYIPTLAIGDMPGLQGALDAKEDKKNKAAAGGYAPLDTNKKVPAAHLPEIDFWDLVPPGLPLIWSKPLGEIPYHKGFQLADGTNGTPNLMGRFLKTTPNHATDPGRTGGSNRKALSIEEMASHDHTFTGKSHTHKVDRHAHDFSADHSHSVDSHNHGLAAATISVNGDHSHSFSTTKYRSGNISDSDSNRITIGCGTTTFALNHQALPLAPAVTPGSLVGPGLSESDTHAITFSVKSDGSHAHTLSGATDGRSLTTRSGTASGTTSGIDLTTQAETPSGTISKTGSGQAFDIQPEYVEIAIIVKVA